MRVVPTFVAALEALVVAACRLHRFFVEALIVWVAAPSLAVGIMAVTLVGAPLARGAFAVPVTDCALPIRRRIVRMALPAMAVAPTPCLIAPACPRIVQPIRIAHMENVLMENARRAVKIRLVASLAKT